MIEKFGFYGLDFKREASRELILLSIISESFFSPFSQEDNLLVILTALTSGLGVGFNRAMLFLAEGDKLKGELWLGPRSIEEAKSIWELLSTPGIGYVEVIEYNRSLLGQGADTLSNRVKPLVYSLCGKDPLVPSLAACEREVIVVRDAWNEPLVDKKFLEVINTESFLCVPLLARDEILGEIVVDNAITKSSIKQRDIELASICGLLAGNYIYTSRLHRKMVEMEKMAARGEMTMFLTHQLRNPIATIGGFADQLLHSEADQTRLRRNLGIISSEIKKLEKTLSDLAQFLRIEIKELSPYQVKEIINPLISHAEARVKKQNVSLEVSVQKDLPRIQCDATYAGEALRNVLSNALDATPERGAISVRAFRQNRNWVVISISDSGQGIPAHLKDKIFVPLFSTKESGMGIGLSYVKRVMDACGGRVEVESQEGKGTDFRLYFKTRRR